MIGNTMEPRFQHGDTLHVNPRKPVRPGDCVVLQVQHDEALKCIVRRFWGVKGEVFVLESMNPARPIEFRSEAVEALHKIMAVSGLKTSLFFPGRFGQSNKTRVLLCPHQIIRRSCAQIGSRTRHEKLRMFLFAPWLPLVAL